MAALYVNVDELRELDFTGEKMERMRDIVSELYNLKHYKDMLTDLSAELDLKEGSTEDTAAELAKKIYICGYMDAVEILTDRYSEIISKAMKPLRAAGVNWPSQSAQRPPRKGAEGFGM